MTSPLDIPAWKLNLRINELEHKVQMLDDEVRFQRREVLFWIAIAAFNLIIIIALVARRIPEVPG